MTDERPDPTDAGPSMMSRTAVRWGVAVLALLVIGWGVDYLIRHDRASEEKGPPAATLPACTEVLGAVGSADDGLAMQDQPTNYEAVPDTPSILCRFEGGDDTETSVVVLLHAQLWGEAAQAVRQLDRSSCPDTVGVITDEAGRQVVSCVPEGHDPAKVEALHAVAAGRLWLSVETTFQYLDSTSAVGTADEARTVELTRAIADALIELALQ